MVLQNGDVAFGSGRFVAVSGAPDSGLGQIAVSEPDGGWTILEELFPPLAGVAHGAGCFVALEDPGEYGDPGAYGGSLLTSSDGLEWKAQPSGLGAGPTAVGFGQPGFVVLGPDGRIGLSPDGEHWTWTQQPGLADGRLRAVAWGNDRYVAVAERTILVSTDGQTWERYRSDTFGTLFDVAYGGGRFVAAGGCGTVVSSVDGRTWRLHDAGMAFQLRGAVFSGAGFVLTSGTSPGLWKGRWSSGLLLQSDPVEPAAPVVRMLDARREVARGEPFTLAVAVSGSPPLSYQWFHGDLPVEGATGAQLTVTGAASSDAGSYLVEVGNGLGQARGGPVELRVSVPPEVELRVVGELGLRVAPATVMVEAAVDDPDGAVVAVEFYLDESLVGTDTAAPFAWEATDLEPGTYRWRARAIDDAGVSACSAVVSARVISPDPLCNWSVENSGLSSGIWALYALAGEYIACSWEGLHFSSNLRDWEWVRLSGDSQPRLVMHGNGWYVAMDHSGYIWRSVDGRVWQRVAIRPTANIWTAAGAFGNGRFVIVGTQGDLGTAFCRYSTTADASNWSGRSVLNVGGFSSVTYGQDRFVAVGRAGTTAWSTEGDEWKVNPPLTSHELTAVTYANGLFVAVGEGGGIWVSPDGVRWSVQRTPGTSPGLNAVAYGGQAFAAVGENGTILTSLDGIQWTVCWGGDNEWWSAVTWGEGRFVAMGPGGLMLRTDATTILDPLGLTPDGRLVCGFAGVAGRTYRLERSEDLIQWTEVAGAAGVHGPMELVDPERPTGPYRFYRVVWTP